VPRRRERTALIASMAAAMLALGPAFSEVRGETQERAPARVEEAPRAADAAPAPALEPDRVAALHASAIVIDTHNDVTLRMTGEKGFDFTKRHTDGHTDLVRMREGGLDAEFLSVWVHPKRYRGEKAWERSLAAFDAIEKTIEASKGEIVLARTAAEVRAAHAAGKTAFLIGVEGAHALGDFGTPAKALERIDVWVARGARYLTLTWNNSNALAGSAGDEGRDTGLTELGRQVVAAMNDRGLIVDVSHVSEKTFADAIAASRLPVLASHSGARALADNSRNLTDDQLRAIAKNGGAVCIVYYPGFLDAGWAKAHKAAQAAAKRAKGAKSADGGAEVEVPPVPLSKLVDHLDHAVKIAGPDHVCLGSDFDGIGDAPLGLEDVSKLPALTAELIRRGYAEGDVRKILGENVLRVLEANERGAKAAP
jgi:membrane dipeptidase